MFSYLSFITSLSWLDENCWRRLTEWALKSRKAAFFGDPHAMWPWLLGQRTHNEVEKELGIRILNNFYSSSYGSGELVGALLKRTLLDGPSSQSTF